MNKEQHPTNNVVLGAPAGWDQGALPCSALPVTHVDVGGGQRAIVSFWRPGPAELAALNAGDPVALWVFGSTMPPVAVEVGHEL